MRTCGSLTSSLLFDVSACPAYSVFAVRVFHGPSNDVNNMLPLGEPPRDDTVIRSPLPAAAHALSGIQPLLTTGKCASAERCLQPEKMLLTSPAGQEASDPKIPHRLHNCVGAESDFFKRLALYLSDRYWSVN